MISKFSGVTLVNKKRFDRIRSRFMSDVNGLSDTLIKAVQHRVLICLSEITRLDAKNEIKALNRSLSRRIVCQGNERFAF